MKDQKKKRNIGDAIMVSAFGLLEGEHVVEAWRLYKELLFQLGAIMSFCLHAFPWPLLLDIP